MLCLATAMMLPTVSIAAPDDAPQGEGDVYPKVNVLSDMRFDYDYKDVEDGDKSSGFYGRYLNLIFHAQINQQLSVHLRQRLNKFGDMKNDVFGATDWAYLDYAPNEKFTFSAGKQVVGIGGYEYDRNPIDIYYASMFWNNIACYQFGVSATYHFDQGKQNLMLQICNSPYQAIGKRCYAYNLMWIGNMGIYHTLWSANLIEYQLNKYGNIISLGNKFDFDNAYLEVDFMNRYWGHGDFLLKDYSLIAKACATIGKFDIFAKGGYEHYALDQSQGFTVDKPFYGIGAEFFPLHGSRNLRLHFVADITHDSATGQRISQVCAGLMWRVSLCQRK